MVYHNPFLSISWFLPQLPLKNHLTVPTTEAPIRPVNSHQTKRRTKRKNKTKEMGRETSQKKRKKTANAIVNPQDEHVKMHEME